MKLNNRLVMETSVAASLVIFGVVIKNTFEQIGEPNHPVGKPFGMLLFVGGWIYTAYILSIRKSNKVAFILPCVGILGAVVMMKQYMAKKEKPPMAFKAIFAISWLVLGFMAGNHLPGPIKYSGLLASLMVVVSMLKILPHQREKKIVDGPGMPLFVIGWVVLVFLNSSR